MLSQVYFGHETGCGFGFKHIVASPSPKGFIMQSLISLLEQVSLLWQKVHIS